MGNAIRDLEGNLAGIADDAFDRRLPPSIEDVMGWGKHRTLTYAEAAQRDPGYMKWAAEKIGGRRGALCAEALALHLGVTE